MIQAPESAILRAVLVVDDAPGCIETMDAALSGIPGIELHFATTAEDALAALHQQRFSALITDVHLPGMSGLELLERLRGQTRFEALPIVVMSGDTDPEIPALSHRLGATCFIAKPYSPAALRKRMEELLYGA